MPAALEAATELPPTQLDDDAIFPAAAAWQSVRAQCWQRLQTHHRSVMGSSGQLKSRLRLKPRENKAHGVPADTCCTFAPVQAAAVPAFCLGLVANRSDFFKLNVPLFA